MAIKNHQAGLPDTTQHIMSGALRGMGKMTASSVSWRILGHLLGSPNLGGGFKYFLFSPLLGEMIQFD